MKTCLPLTIILEQHVNGSSLIYVTSRPIYATVGSLYTNLRCTDAYWWRRPPPRYAVIVIYWLMDGRTRCHCRSDISHVTVIRKC